MPRVTEMYAFVVSDTEPDDEGVIGQHHATWGWLPFVGADVTRATSLEPIAQTIADQLGKQVRLIRFEGPPEVVKVLEPRPLEVAE